ncbi:MAG: hypothetical protein EA375_03655 [Acholeplasmataceae bacterium]|nr:MAG: hypothetical protein EA375_03655 [Acholeplasmataceae bacterium]
MRRKHPQTGLRQRHYRYMRKPGQDKTIMLKEESLYKPLLVTFLVLLFAMVIVFPISIFDNLFPDFMFFLRRMISLLSLSAVATLLVLPVSVLDVELLRVFSRADLYDDFYVMFVIAFAVFADTLFSYIGYKFTKTLRKVFVRKAKKADIEKSNAKLQKYGNLGMFFFAWTPLPFTLAVYTAGAVRLNRKGFLLAVAAGRTIKYSAFALALRLFDINLIDFFQNIFQAVFG